jgi:hypothetical protein
MLRIKNTKLFGSYEVNSAINQNSPTFFLAQTDELSKKVTNFCNQSFISYECIRDETISERKLTCSSTDRFSYTYGEITLKSLLMIFDQIRNLNQPNTLNQSKSGCFVDIGNLQVLLLYFFIYSIFLGSGLGLPVFMAAFLGSFNKCVGIEILKSLSNISNKGKKVWDSNYLLQYKTEIEFYNGSLTDLSLYDWTQGDIVFANSTCFDDNLFLFIESVCDRIKPGSYLVTLSQSINLPAVLELAAELRLDMSW